ncbi:methyltransferase domain-containing protein [Thermodesulfobacteriota bacterium]
MILTKTICFKNLFSYTLSLIMVIAITDIQNIFVCPNCHGNFKRISGELICFDCSHTYPIVEGIPMFGNVDNKVEDKNREERQTFWDKGWGKRISTGSQRSMAEMNKEELVKYIELALEKLKHQKHHLVREISSEAVREQTVLDIGCGAGLQAPILSHYGANYIGIDLSHNAALQSSKYIATLEGQGVTAQADAEFLPLRSKCIDNVYSHGVLHHTPNTASTIAEINRVLKPGGKAIIGLYVTYSPKFIVDRLLGQFKVFLGKQNFWFNSGEGAWHSAGHHNPWTKTYSKKELTELFRNYDYSGLAFRKFSFRWGNCLPPFGKYIDRTIIGQNLANMVSPILGDIWSIQYTKG